MRDKFAKTKIIVGKLIISRCNKKKYMIVFDMFFEEVVK